MIPMRVLLAQDVAPSADDLAQGLSREGVEVARARTGSAALAALRTGPHALLLLDLGLPGPEVAAVLDALRRHEIGVPVIVLAARDAVVERIAALDAGAHDYLIRPIAQEELLARMRSVSRRHAGQALPVLSAGQLRLDPARHQVWLGGSRVAVSPREFVILQELMIRPGEVLSVNELKRRLYSMGDRIASNVLQVHIHNLRRKLGRLTILNVRGVGYRVGEQP